MAQLDNYTYKQLGVPKITTLAMLKMGVGFSAIRAEIAINTKHSLTKSISNMRYKRAGSVFYTKISQNVPDLVAFVEWKINKEHQNIEYKIEVMTSQEAKRRNK